MLSSEIKSKALELGYLACGIIPANIFDEYTQYLDKRVASFPESKELYAPLYGIARQPETAKSVIVCTKRYNTYKISDNLNGRIGKIYLFEPRGPYTQEFRDKNGFEAYLKKIGLSILQSYVPARWAAAKAGLGKFGQNNFIYTTEHGSYIWIDTWVVDTELEHDNIEKDTMQSACNNSCHKCIQACPTHALSDSLSMDRGRCVAHLSWKAKDTLDEDTRVQMGQWLYGCDVCQDVCPVNQDRFTETEVNPLIAEIAEYLEPERLLEMDESTYLDIINPRFHFIDKDSLWLWKCNALRSIINSGETKHHALIKQCCEHDDIRIRELAQWGCERLEI